MKLSKKQISLIAALIVAGLSALGFNIPGMNADHDSNRGQNDRYADNRSSARPNQREAQYRPSGSTRKIKNTGNFDYYSLVMTWSPTYCADNAGDRRTDAQCNGPRPYAFVLHGLWPQYDKGYPESCQVKDNWVPKDVINDMLDIMPAKGLVLHQWRKHGTCSGLSPRDFFEQSEKAYRSVKIPSRYQNPKSPIYVTPQKLESDFLKANPSLDEDNLSISCGRKKRRLREIRICLTKDLKPTQCGPNESQRKLCREKQIVLPPVR